MTILDLLVREDKTASAKIFALVGVAAIFNTLGMVIINSVAASPESATVGSFVLLFIVVAVSVLFARQRSRRINATVEASLHRIKLRIVEKIERMELAQFERIDRSEILDRLTENVASISLSAPLLGEVLQSIIVGMCATLYVYLLSPLAFAILCVCLSVIVCFYRARWSLTRDLLRQWSGARIQFLAALMDLLNGAKEIRLSRARRVDVLRDYDRRVSALRSVNTSIDQVDADDGLFARTNLYVMCAGVVLLWPQHGVADARILPKVLSALLFMWGSLEWAMGFYGTYLQTNEALDQIAVLEGKLDSIAPSKKDRPAESDPWRGMGGRIAATQIEYVYPAQNGDVPFHIGPIDLTIEPGEVVFIVGGNGSGKSTLLKVLTGLYVPTGGSLRLNDCNVGPSSVAAYRELIAAIFADYHLFSKAYGMLDADPEVIRRLLHQLEIDRKTSFQNGEFFPRKLSTGQKKRIAMAIALFDDRPIFVLDEWAADQDPEFRKYFYTVLIPALKRKGKTVIAVSHDDRYFHVADRVVVLAYGKIRTIKTNHLTSIVAAVHDEASSTKVTQ